MTVVQIAAVVAAYLIGSISFARIVAARLLPDTSITTTSFPVANGEEIWTYTGVSAASVLKRAGAKWGIVIIVLDALKAFVPTLTARLVWPNDPVYLAVALGVVVGHIWPIWHRFHGGRGQSSMLGAMLAIDPVAIPAAVVISAAVGVVVFTSVYLARNGGPFVVWMWFAATTGWSAETIFGVLLGAVYLMASWSDLIEEQRVRTALGFSSVSWSKRLGVAARDFFSAKD